MADEAEGELTTCAQENLTGVRVVRAFGRERYEVDRFNRRNQRFSQLWIRLGKLLSIYWASGTLLTCLQVMVIILVGTVETVHGNMTLGAFFGLHYIQRGPGLAGTFPGPCAVGYEQGWGLPGPGGLHSPGPGGAGRPGSSGRPPPATLNSTM